MGSVDRTMSVDTELEDTSTGKYVLMEGDEGGEPSESEKKPTPLPKKQMACAIALQMCEGFNITVLFPFVNFMVESFGYTGKGMSIAAGVVVASFCAGQLVSSIGWGYFSDRYGRRTALLAGAVGNAVTMVMLGFSTSLPYAIAARFLSGVLNGNVGILKSWLAETCDETNRAKGFSILPLAYGAAAVLAPAMGGVLNDPARQYPSVFSETGLFGTFRILLPCLVTAFLFLVTLVICMAFLMEPVSFAPSSKPSFRLLRERPVLSAVLSYCGFCLANIILDETVPFHLKDKAGYSAARIGAVLSLGGLSLFLTPTLVPWLIARIGLRRTFTTSLGALALATAVWPLSTEASSTGLYVAEVLLSAWRNWTASIAFAVSMLMVNNSSHQLGAVNGIAQSVAAATRCVGPVLAGVMWGVSSLSFPVITGLLLVSAATGKLLPADLENAPMPNTTTVDLTPATVSGRDYSELLNPLHPPSERAELV